MAERKITYKRFRILYLVVIFTTIMTTVSLNLVRFQEPVFDVTNMYSPKELMAFINKSNSQEPPFHRLKFIDNIGDWITNISQQIHGHNPFSAIKSYLEELKCQYHIRKVRKTFYEINPDTSPDFIAFTHHSIYKPLINGADLPYPSTNFTIDMAKGEYESFQILLLPSSSDLRNIKVSIDKSDIPSSCFNFYEAGWVNCRPPVYSTPHNGWYIDPLLSMQYDSTLKYFHSKTYDISAKQNEVSTIWANILTPKNIASGVYPIELSVTANDKNGKVVKQKCRLKVHIYNVAYPSNPTFKTAFSFNWELYMWYYNIPEFNFDVRKKIYDFFFTYRINPVELNRFGKLFPPLEDWDYVVKKGARAICLGYYSPPTDKDTMAFHRFDSTFKSDIKALKNNALKKYAFLFAFDEQNYNIIFQDRVSYKKEFHNLRNYVDKIDKSIPIATTTEFDEELKGYLNWWMPINIYYEPTIAKKCIRTQDEQWWSVTMSTNPPYPTFFIDANAIEPRILFWQGSKYNINGFKYYETILWQSNVCWAKGQPVSSPAEINSDPNICKALQQGKRWPDVPWNSYSWTKYNGDGMLIYPGKNGELLPSVRLLNIRDGIEDFELLELLKNKIKKSPSDKSRKAILDKLYSITPNFKNYENNPEQLLSNKRDLLKELESH